MPVLTDNYTTHYQQSSDYPTFFRKPRFGFINETPVSSLVLSNPTPFCTNHRILELLDEFELLDANWDQDEAMKPSFKAIENARFITQLLGKHGQQVYHAAPGPNGEIMLEIRNKRKSRSLELVFYNNRSVAVKFSEEYQPQQLPFSNELLPGLLNWLNSK